MPPKHIIRLETPEALEAPSDYQFKLDVIDIDVTRPDN